MSKFFQHVLCCVLLCLLANVTSAQERTVITKIGRGQARSIENYFDTSLAPFYHGVASGDPLQDAVIIWTRVTANQKAVPVKWSVSLQPNMSQVISSGTTITNEEADYTVKIDVRNLAANQTYYYQFEALGRKSIIGKTRTAPAGNVSNVRFGVVSCSNYQNGYFNAYNELAKRTDIDAVIHLGDYIYEYESGGYGYSKSLGRGHVPANEIVTLNDYRIRYSYYRLDPMLRNLHQQHPFILVWDDHEFANDANKYGAENHSPSKEGSWEARKRNAHKAYFEWLPVRANSIEEYRLYRDFSYGNLADLLMLDTRIEGRGESVASGERFQSISEKDLKAKVKAYIETHPLNTKAEIKTALEFVMPYFIDKSMLSKEEEEFLLTSFTEVAFNFKNEGVRRPASDIDTQKLEALLQKSVKTNFLAERVNNKGTYTSILGKPQFDWLLNKLSQSKATWKLLGNQVMMMYYRGVPTKDAWDGYKEERAKIHEFVLNNNIDNVVVLTGDIHSTFAGNIEHNGKCVASEFVVPSVTSQNVDVVGNWAAKIAEWYTKSLNRHMKEVDLDPHGYYVLDVKEQRVQADWYYINDIKRPNSGQYFHKGFYVNKGRCGIHQASNPARATSASNYGAAPVEVTQIKEALSQNFVFLGLYPNPMEWEGNLHYIIQKPTDMSAALYDLQGKKVKSLVLDKHHEAGVYNISFEVTGLSKGHYLMKITVGTQVVTRQMVVR